MKESAYRTLLMSVALTLVGCSQEDSITENALPEGKYPLQIGSVTIAGTNDTQTRISESNDGMGSSFASGDEISVKIGDDGEVGTYTYNGSGFTVVTPCYWQDTNTATVTAWYPSGIEATTIDLSDQSSGLKYVLLATATDASCKKAVSCTFHNQLSKIRVKLDGDQATDIASDDDAKIYLKTYKSCTSTKGKVTTDGAEVDYIQMYKATYGSNTYWEATVVPGYAVEYVKLYGIECKLSKPITPVAGNIHVVTISFGNYKPLTKDVTISGNETYYFTGSSSHSINIIGGSPNIYLKSAQINTGGIGINITGGNPTIHAIGSDNSITSSGSAGIFVAEGSTVTITGDSRDDVMKVTGSSGSSGIGGYIYDPDRDTYVNCGNITISGITVYAYSNGYTNLGSVSPAIGGAGGGDCGTITISDATVYAYGCMERGLASTAAIGIGNDFTSRGNRTSPTVNIKNGSIVHAHRHINDDNINEVADYIGKSANDENDATVRATIDANSMVYCYTGSGDTEEKTVTGPQTQE